MPAQPPLHDPAPPARSVLLVGLTGGIATGKSEVDRILQVAGVEVIDADAIVHRLLAEDPSLRHDLVAAFGAGILDAAGAVDRRALGRIVFRDASARERLNALVHPRVRGEILEAVKALRRQPGPGAGVLLVVDAALMVETGFHRSFDRLVVVTAPLDVRIRRLAQRDGLDRDAALARIAAQGPEDAKLAAAHYVIVNDGSLAELAACVREVHGHLLEDLRRRDGKSEP